MRAFIDHVTAVISEYKFAAILWAITGLTLILFSSMGGYGNKVYLYLLVMTGAIFFSEIFIFAKGIKFQTENWFIKSPKKELIIIVFTQVIVAILLIYWFLIAKQHVESQAVKVSMLVLRALFVFPIFFLLYFVWYRKYSLKQLGITNSNYWYIALPIIGLIGLSTYLAYSEGLQFEKIINQNGYLSLLLLGFLTAAIPEEVTRVLLQTRLSQHLNSKTFGWYLAGVIWAFLHLPIFAFRADDYSIALMNVIGILPIGLLWGYLNERYKSIIPSVLIHGTNLWGLQNLY